VKYAIRPLANDNLQRNITELLTRPVGRLSHKPVVRFKSFLYQAASWKPARRVAAKGGVPFRGIVLLRRLHRDQSGDLKPGGGAVLK
jgi:hypothetical protein